MQTLYLNNSGHRWINIDSKTGKREKVIVYYMGKFQHRSVDLWEAIGNFAVPNVRIKGKQKRLCNYERVGVQCWTTFEVKYPNSFK